MAGSGPGNVLLADLVRTALGPGGPPPHPGGAGGNQPALALYRRFGMAPVGVRRNYYPVTGDDALIMWARDIDTPVRRRLADIESSLAPGFEVSSRR